MSETENGVSESVETNAASGDSSPRGPVKQLITVPKAGLRELGKIPPLGTYLHDLWLRRHFIFAEARARAFQTTKEYRLWRLWLVLNPLLDVALYGFLFGLLFDSSRGIENFVGYLFLGITFMRILTRLLNDGAGLMTRSRQMIRTFHFPRVAIPISQTIRAAYDNLLPAVTAIVAAFAFQWGKFPSWAVVCVIPLYIMLHIFGCGLMMILARMTVEVPDVRALVGIFTRAWFLLSGVMYSAEAFRIHNTIYEVMVLNPAYVFLTALRDATIYQSFPDLRTWAHLLAWTVGVFMIGFLYFWRGEKKYARIA